MIFLHSPVMVWYWIWSCFFIAQLPYMLDRKHEAWGMFGSCLLDLSIGLGLLDLRMISCEDAFGFVDILVLDVAIHNQDRNRRIILVWGFFTFRVW